MKTYMLKTEVRVGNLLSDHFLIGRGIRHGSGSVMSPSLFNLVMDPLLVNLKSKELGLYITHGLFLGAFAHADNFRTTTKNLKRHMLITDHNRASFAVKHGPET